jgi:hypothetical protein
MGFSSRPFFKALAASSLWLAVALASCAESSDSTCERNSDCDRGYCQKGKCRRDCVDGALDCPKVHHPASPGGELQ